VSIHVSLQTVLALASLGDSQDFGPVIKRRKSDRNGIAQPVTPKPLQIGRNDPCCCGSGKKFKACCRGKR
jgi:uncharacterized protein YecA (UPF0149 family)